jgi:hypothetical protein
MALNPPLDPHSGLPLALVGEQYLLHRGAMACEAHLVTESGSSGVVKAGGDIFLTTR